MRRMMIVRRAEDPVEAVALVDTDEPTCGDEDIVVEIVAAPLNPADLLLVTGRHLVSLELPSVVGIEGAGVVVEAGSASCVAVGTNVAVPYGGTWSERVVVRAEDAIPLPDNFPLEQAAMLSVNPFTVAGLLEGLPKGSYIALNAAGSSLGRMVLALARRRGLQVVAIVRRAEIEAELRGLGASAVVVDGPRLAEDVAKATGGAAIIRAFDAVAGDATGRLFSVVANGGALWVYGLLGDDRVVLPARDLVFRDVTVRGYSRLSAFLAMSPTRRAELATELTSLMADGTLTTHVAARYSLDDFAAALAHHARPDRRGKILFCPGARRENTLVQRP